MASNKIQVKFLHPRDSREFTAELGPATTGTQAIEGLVREKFVDPPSAERSYVLKHGGKTIALSASVAGSGVQDGDVVTIVESSAGAGA